MTFLRAVLTVIFAGLFVVAASAQTAPGRRVALVIGNSAYAAQGTLANPGPDSRLVADALRRVGFTVTARNDLGKQAMELALRDFSRAADGAEVALIYYAGHGMEANGVNWLLPVDAVLAEERNLRFEAIDLDTTLAAVEGAKGLRMVVLDACRNNPFARSMRRSSTTRATVTRGLADVEVTGTLVLYAARGGTVAQDGVAGGNSPFAAAFARRIPEPGVDVRLLISKVRDDVLDSTGRVQEPFSYGSLPGVELSLTPPPAMRARPDAQWVEGTSWRFHKLDVASQGTCRETLSIGRAELGADGRHQVDVNFGGVRDTVEISVLDFEITLKREGSVFHNAKISLSGSELVWTQAGTVCRYRTMQRIIRERI
jgi:hypothetical protein